MQTKTKLSLLADGAVAVVELLMKGPAR